MGKQVYIVRCSARATIGEAWRVEAESTSEASLIFENQGTFLRDWVIGDEEDRYNIEVTPEERDAPSKEGGSEEIYRAEQRVAGNGSIYYDVFGPDGTEIAYGSPGCVALVKAANLYGDSARLINSWETGRQKREEMSALVAQIARMKLTDEADGTDLGNDAAMDGLIRRARKIAPQGESA